MIDKKNALQMIDLVFHANRFDPGADFFVEFATFVLPAKADPLMTLQECRVIRKAHTTLLARFRLFFFKDHGIHKNETLSPRLTP